MVGGIVIDIVEFPNHYALHVHEHRSASKCWVNCRKTIRTLEGEEKTVPIAFGDAVWWQGTVLLWTPADGYVQDVKLERVGPTYANHPGIPKRERSSQ